jgi:hypothetical protein
MLYKDYKMNEIDYISKLKFMYTIINKHNIRFVEKSDYFFTINSVEKDNRIFLYLYSKHILKLYINIFYKNDELFFYIKQSNEDNYYKSFVLTNYSNLLKKEKELENKKNEKINELIGSQNEEKHNSIIFNDYDNEIINNLFHEVYVEIFNYVI